MDNSPEIKKAPAAASANVAKPAESPSAAPAQPAANGDYKTADIGKWKSKQEDYFAKQNKERSEKKAKQKANLKKALPFIIAGGTLVVVGLLTWGVISLINYINRPTLEETASDPSVISGNSSAAIEKYQDYLQQVYNDALAKAMAEEGTDVASDEAKKEANSALSEAIAKSANTEAGEKYRDARLMSELMVYYGTLQCDQIFRIENQINPDNLNLLSLYRYNVVLQNCYQVNGDNERADALWRTIVDLYSQVYYGDNGVLREGVAD